MAIIRTVLFYYDPAEGTLKCVAESSPDDGGNVAGVTAVSPAICGLPNHLPGQALHAFRTSPHPDAPHSYCLPLWSNDRFVGLLQMYLPATEPLNAEQISIFDRVASAIALSLDTSALDNLEFLKAEAARRERERVARHHEGIQTISLDRIVGSEGRDDDFDSSFRPRRENGRDRWVSVALARAQGKSLPPVSLVRLGDAYYVRDGHHRISVARALNELEIEAEVIGWQTA